MRSLRTMAVLSLLAAAMGGQARPDVVRSGSDSNDGSYTTSTLSAAAILTDTVTTGGLAGISFHGHRAKPCVAAVPGSMPAQ